MTNLELTARFTQSAIDHAIAGLAGNGCEEAQEALAILLRAAVRLNDAGDIV